MGPIVVQRAIDGPITDGVLSDLWQYVAIFVGALASAFVLRYIQTIIMNRVGQGQGADLVDAVFTDLFDKKIQIAGPTAGD